MRILCIYYLFLIVCLQAKIIWNVFQDIFNNFLAHLSIFNFWFADWGIAIISKSQIVRQLVRQLVKSPFSDNNSPEKSTNILSMIV